MVGVVSLRKHIVSLEMWLRLRKQAPHSQSFVYKFVLHLSSPGTGFPSLVVEAESSEPQKAMASLAHPLKISTLSSLHFQYQDKMLSNEGVLM